MPSEMMHRNGLSSSSLFSEKRQMGFWKTETTPDHYCVKIDGVLGGISVPSLPLEKRMTAESKMVKHAVGAERAATNSSRRPVGHDPEMGFKLNTEPASNFREGDEIRVMGAQYENGLFSSSLSELFSRKLKLTSNNALYGHPVGDATSHYEEDEPFESLDEIEAQTIGNLLPSDDDLLSGVTDGLDYVVQPNAGEEIEDLDLFSSVGGMDLGEYGFPPGKIDSELPGGDIKSHLQGSFNSLIGEHPSRTLIVRNINSNVENSELWALFEQYGDIRTLYATRKHRGFVMISYYDIRAARNAMRALQKKPLKRMKLDIHFSIVKDNLSEKDVKQGTLVVFNLDSSVSNEELHQIFGVCGEIMEIREAPKRSHHKFIEFYDVRAAEAALHALNRGDIGGKRIKLEPSRAGCGTDCLMPFPPDSEQDESGPYRQLSSSPSTSTTGFSGPVTRGGIKSAGMGNGTISGVHSAIRAPVSPFLENVLHHGMSSSVPTSVSSVVRVESLGNQSSLYESGHSQGQLKVELQGSPHFHPHSFQEYHDGFTNGSPCNSSDMAVNIKARPSNRIENRPFSRVSSNGHPFEPNDAIFYFPRNGTMPSPGHQYLWSNAPQPRPQCLMWPNSPTFVNGVCTAHPASRLHALPRAPPHMLNTFLPITGHHVGSAPSANPHFWDRRNTYAGESPNASCFQPGSLGNMRISGSTNEWPRSRRNEGSANQADNKKQFELGIDRIMRGEDNRTTLMIKNIPNKYTSKMLLAAIDERHKGTYDFLYLPIDFKNKCNVGYAFINMIDPSLIIPFYEAFNGKKWEKFNSEKVASLAYARIQGKYALIAHFQNSSLMNEDKLCRPLLFDTDGPNAGDQVPFPMGVNIPLRPSKTEAVTSKENHHESAPNLPNGEESFNGDLSSRSTKDSV